MFSFENQFFQPHLERVLSPHGRNKKNSSLLLDSFRDCVQGLTKDEVDIILALRSLDWSVRTELLMLLSSFVRARSSLYDYVSNNSSSWSGFVNALETAFNGQSG